MFAVTMQAQRETPSDMQCKDKFLIQSVVSASTEVYEELVRSLLIWKFLCFSCCRFNTNSGIMKGSIIVLSSIVEKNSFPQVR